MTLKLIRETVFRGWPAVCMARDRLQVHLVPAIGGRIMGIAFDGQELAYQQPERLGEVPDAGERAHLATWRQRLGFPLWGGGKTWLAPETAFPGGVPHPDLDSGPYGVRIAADRPQRIAVRMDSGVCRDTCLQLSRLVEMASHRPGWRVVHRAVNRGSQTWHGGLWDVLMLRRPVEVHWPVARVTVMPGKAHPEVGEAAIDGETVRCDRAAEFKLGGTLRTGWTAARLGRVGYRRCFAVPAGAAYAHGWPAEIYNAAKYAYSEIESHGPHVKLAPGQTTTFTVSERVDAWPSVAAERPDAWGTPV